MAGERDMAVYAVCLYGGPDFPRKLPKLRFIFRVGASLRKLAQDGVLRDSGDRRGAAKAGSGQDVL